MNHDLPLEKLSWMQSTQEVISLRVKVNNTLSDLKEINFRVPQGSILGLLPFNVFVNAMFLFIGQLETDRT